MEYRRSLVLRATPFFGLLFLTTLYTFNMGSRLLQSNPKMAGRNTDADLQSRILEDQHRLHLLMKSLVEDTGENDTQLETTGFACHSNIKTEVCVSDRPVTIDTSTMTVYMPFSQGVSEATRTVMPYPFRDDTRAMEKVSPVQIFQGNSSTPPPICHYSHDVPAVVFSSGGFTGNTFHALDLTLIPLFLTTHSFKSRLRFVIVDYKPKFIDKIVKIISHLSSYEVINAAKNGSVHCFPGVVVGLHYHDYLTIHPSVVPKGHSMLGFKEFLREAYNLKTRDSPQAEKPILLLISREESRMFLNEDRMVAMMEALGFKVIVAKPNMTANTETFPKIVQSCSVMVGAHGAGLTNLVFMPRGAVLVQVVGLAQDWASAKYFGAPSKRMGLRYIEYKIEPEESSLITLYGKDDPVIVDPASVTAKGFQMEYDVYLLQQNFNIDVVRFNQTLVRALKLVGR